MEALIGARITEEGIEFFGTDEVNSLLASGHRVTKIEPGEVIVEEVPPEVSMSEDEQEYTLAGFEIIVTLDPPQ
jgi:hypothetical protein